MKRLIILMFVLLPLKVLGREDSLAGAWALANKPGSLSLSYAQHYRVDTQWYDSVNHLEHPTRGQQFVFRNGRAVSRKIVSLAVILAWQVSVKNYFSLELPAHFAELSDLNLSSLTSLPVGDPGIVRQDQVGDLALQWRRHIWSSPLSALVFSLGLRVPTGTHPFQAGQTLLGMGVGGYEGSVGVHSAVVVSGQRLWVDGVYRANAGYEAVVPAGAFLSPSRVWKQGPAFIRPGGQVELLGGYLVDWYRTARSRHSFALEVRYIQQEETQRGGRTVAQSGRTRLDLLPQMHFRFLNSFAMVVGFSYPLAGNGDMQIRCGSNGLCDPDIHARLDFDLR